MSSTENISSAHIPLADLDAASPFRDRHIGPRPDDQATMLKATQWSSLSELLDARGPGRHP